MSFAEQQPRPHDRKDGAELEERRHISNETQGNCCEPEEWCDPCNADRHEKGVWLCSQSPNPFLLPECLPWGSCCTRTAQRQHRIWGQQEHREYSADESDKWAIWRSDVFNGQFLQYRGHSPQSTGEERHDCARLFSQID